MGLHVKQRKFRGKSSFYCIISLFLIICTGCWFCPLHDIKIHFQRPCYLSVTCEHIDIGLFVHIHTHKNSFRCGETKTNDVTSVCQRQAIRQRLIIYEIYNFSSYRLEIYEAIEADNTDRYVGFHICLYE
jgi:hypothetical protein